MNLSGENLAWSSLCGVGRSMFVHSLIYPLEVIKVRQQCCPSQANCFQIASNLIRNEGIFALYKGLNPLLLKTSIKQIWCWPIIMGMPPFLESSNIATTSGQALTGLTIATLDAAISTPLERAKIASAFQGKNILSLKQAYQDGWSGFTAHWSKLSVTWVTFLTAQKHLRGEQNQPLSLLQLVKVGVEVALLVSLLSAPFDIANTLKHAHDATVSLRGRNLFRLYRGWPLHALCLVIHNIASIILIEKLERS